MKNTKRKNFKKGNVMTLTVLFFLSISLIVIFSLAANSVKDYRNNRNLILGKNSYYISESGIEDAFYRLKNKLLMDSNNMPIGNDSASVTITDNGDGTATITSLSTTSDYYKRVQAKVSLETNISFKYSAQSGTGGIVMTQPQNAITGDVYTQGSVGYSSNNIDDITGNLICTSASSTAYGINVTGSVYCNTIGASGAPVIVGLNAYYNSLVGSVTISGTSYPNSPVQSTTTFPITDDQITKWENLAASGTVIASSWCSTYSGGICTINTSKTISTTTFPFELVVSGNGTVITVSGPVWVKGNLTVGGGSSIKMAASLGTKNVPIIAHNPTNTSTSSQIIVQQNATFSGSGASSSYVFMISQNNSSEIGGSNIAVSLSQSSNALVAYANHGYIELNNKGYILQATGYKIGMYNQSKIIYDSGLDNVAFASGSSGIFGIIDWGQI